MPSKLHFTTSDKDFLGRYFYRIKQRDVKLKYEKQLLKKISEECKSHSISIFTRNNTKLAEYEYNKAVELANEFILPLLTNEQRTALSKARYAYHRKKKKFSDTVVELDGTTSHHLAELVGIAEKFAQKHDYGSDLKFSKKSVLRNIITTFYYYTYEDGYPEATDDIALSIQGDLIRHMINEQKSEVD